MLTREFLKQANCQSSFGTIDENLLLSAEQRSASLLNFLRTKPSNGPLWVFGYGSLMWNPLLEYSQVETATLHGWQRDFCLTLVAGRASAEQPGRMLALVEGGKTVGRAFKLHCASWQAELELLWKREMITGCYRPTWQQIEFGTGEKVDCLVFVANPEHPLYNAEASLEQKAKMIAQAVGPLGKNISYLQEMIATFQRLGIIEPQMHKLACYTDKLYTELTA